MLSLLFLLLVSTATKAQFTEIKTTIADLSYSSVAWGDYDNDGDLDLLISGENYESTSIAKLYANQSNGTFIDTKANLPQVDLGSVSWGDYDNDLDLDILILGWQGKTGIYQNNKTGFRDTQIDLPQLQWCKGIWGDYDLDGDLDIAMAGKIGGKEGYTSKIYRNEGDSTFTDIFANLSDVSFSSLTWGDYDNDGDLDLLMTGVSNSSLSITRIYRNDNGLFNDTFANIESAEGFGSATWGDYDNDGDLDVLLAKRGRSVIYQNKEGLFKDIDAKLIAVQKSNAAWIDYDNDGDLDAFLMGFSIDTKSCVAKIYKNEGNNQFTDTKIEIKGVQLGSAAWGDYDLDGDQDLIVSGEDGKGSYKTYLYQNNHDQTTPNNANNTKKIGLTPSAIGFQIQNSQLSQTKLSEIVLKAIEQDETNPAEVWFDYDGDSDLDLGTPFGTNIVIYNNDNGKFNDLSATNANAGTQLSTSPHRVFFGDIDGDGLNDMVVNIYNPNSPNLPTVKIFRNDPNNAKRNRYLNINLKINITQNSYVLLGNYNDDKLADIIAIKEDPANKDKWIDLVYTAQTASNAKNNKEKDNKNTSLSLPKANTPPTAPQNLKHIAKNNKSQLYWEKSTDDNTPANALTYNVYVGKIKTKTTAIAAMADLKTGKLLLPKLGNNGSLLNKELKNLPPAKYYWTVQAIDNSFSASAFAPIDSFTISQNLPAIVSNLNDSGRGSLRDAIDISNNNTGNDTIKFAFSNSLKPPFVITPLTDLPSPKNKKCVVDASNIKTERIEIDGNLINLVYDNSISQNEKNKLVMNNIVVKNFSKDVIATNNNPKNTKPSNNKTIAQNKAKDDKLANLLKNKKKEKFNELAKLDGGKYPTQSKRINLTRVYLGVNYLALSNPIQGRLGLSLYYPLGLFAEGFKTYKDPLPNNKYSMQYAKEIIRNYNQRGIDYMPIRYKESKGNFQTANFGVYIQTLDHLYFKIGVSQIKGSVWDLYSGSFVENDLQDTGKPFEYALDYRQVKTNDILMGLALVYPYFQAEAGYNKLLNTPFITLGVNYPIKNFKDFLK